MKKIMLTRGAFAIVDADDFPLLSKHKWHLTGTKYAARKNPGSNAKPHLIYMHRVIMSCGSKKQVDHINGIPLDNRKKNLRIVSSQKNKFNSKKHSDGSSKFKGVSWDKRAKKWSVNICKGYKKLFLGYFDVENEAARVYNEKAVQLFGSYARQNNI